MNGLPVKGVAVYHFRQVILSTNPNPGQAIADVTRTGYGTEIFEILKQDGTPIGTITAQGLGVGLPPPGAPLLVTQGNRVILGGTGAFLGVRGQTGNMVTAQTVNPRAASMAEDPANRRSTTGGRERRVTWGLGFVKGTTIPFGPVIYWGEMRALPSTRLSCQPNPADSFPAPLT